MDRGKYRVQVGRLGDDAHRRNVAYLDQPPTPHEMMTRSEFARAIRERYPDVLDPFTWEYVDWIGGGPKEWPPDPEGPAVTPGS